HLCDVGDGSPEDDAVQRVQDLRTELGRHSLADARVLRHREGLVQARRPANLEIAGCAAKLPFRRQREGAPVQVEVSSRIEVRHRDVPPDVARDEVWAESAVKEKQRIRNGRRQAAAAVVRIHQGELPAAENLAGGAVRQELVPWPSGIWYSRLVPLFMVKLV